jgi:hypothetical protein
VIEYEIKLKYKLKNEREPLAVRVDHSTCLRQGQAVLIQAQMKAISVPCAKRFRYHQRHVRHTSWHELYDEPTLLCHTSLVNLKESKMNDRNYNFVVM